MKERPNQLLWVLFASYFTFGIVLNVVGVVIPILIHQYNLSLFTGGLLAFALYIPFGVCSIPAGLAADRLGAKPIVLSGVFLMTVGCGAIPWATSFACITILAFVIGAGVALLETAGNPLVAHLDRRENYHRNLTLTIGFCGVGAFAGPICLSALQSNGQPWQHLYIYYALLCASLLIFLAFSNFPKREVLAKDKLHLREIGKVFVHPIAITYFLAVFFYVGAEVGTASWIAKFFQQIHGLKGERVSSASTNIFVRYLPALPILTVSLFWWFQALGRLTSGRGLQKLGARLMLRLYTLGALASLVLAIFAPVKVAACAFIACGFFTSILITLLFSGAIHSFRDSQGTISGLLVTASMGGAIIPPLVGFTADHLGLQTAMIIPALCFVYVFVVSMVGKATYE